MLLLAAARGALAFAPSPGEGSRGARPPALAAKKARKKRAVSGPPARAELPEGAARPRLVVFDLDNTLWTPELHTLRKQPKAGKDVALCGGAVDALFDLATGDGWRATSAAVASRAEEKEWAEALLESFEVEGRTAASLLPHREIYPGSKTKHFRALSESTGVGFEDMLFFDDYTANLGEITQLGVLCVHTPRGLTRDHWVGGLKAYALLKSRGTTFMGRMFSTADLGELA